MCSLVGQLHYAMTYTASAWTHLLCTLGLSNLSHVLANATAAHNTGALELQLVIAECMSV